MISAKFSSARDLISLTFPEPTNVLGSGLLRVWRDCPTVLSPAVSASKVSSANESSRVSGLLSPIIFTPTKKARSLGGVVGIARFVIEFEYLSKAEYLHHLYIAMVYRLIRSHQQA
jgi:hypothetical protein